MNKRNYQAELDKIILGINGEKKPKLLLHCCCAPCASYCLTYLKDYFDITAFYYNPNITDLDEYNKRLAELERFSSTLNVKVIDGGYNADLFYSSTKGMGGMAEGGERCYICYDLRLDKTAVVAKEGGYDYFCSTLSISPLKSTDKLNQIGDELAIKHGVKHNVLNAKNHAREADIVAQAGRLGAVTIATNIPYTAIPSALVTEEGRMLPARAPVIVPMLQPC